jgi:hypothetical protein
MTAVADTCKYGKHRRCHKCHNAERAVRTQHKNWKILSKHQKVDLIVQNREGGGRGKTRNVRLGEKCGVVDGMQMENRMIYGTQRMSET